MNITIAMQCLIVYIKAKVDFTYLKKKLKRGGYYKENGLKLKTSV